MTDVLPAEGVGENELLGEAAALEQHSEHPLAKAVMACAKEKALSVGEVTDFQALPGNGLRAMRDGRELVGGSGKYMAGEVPVLDSMERRAGTPRANGCPTRGPGTGRHHRRRSHDAAGRRRRRDKGGHERGGTHRKTQASRRRHRHGKRLRKARPSANVRTYTGSVLLPRGQAVRGQLAQGMEKDERVANKTNIDCKKTPRSLCLKASGSLCPALFTPHNLK